MEKYLIHLCDMRDIESLKRETHALLNFPMFNGIRSQVRRVLRHVQRKCQACGIHYRGPDPDHLPMMLKFQSTSTQKTREVGVAQDQP
jgi:hypothetical protein